MQLHSSAHHINRNNINATSLANGFPKTRRNDGTADETAISKYIGRDSPQSVDNYPISTQNPTVIQRLDDFVSRYFVCAKCSARRKFVVGHSIFLSSLLLFSRPMYLLIAVPSFRLLLMCPPGRFLGMTFNYCSGKAGVMPPKIVGSLS